MNPNARATLTPIAMMLAVAVLLVGGAVALDSGWTVLADPDAWLSGLQGGAALDRVGNAAEVVAGVLAIAITVVAIVVELAANRYTHRITQLFVRDTTNQLVLAFFVLTTIVCLWTSAAPLEQIADARITATLAMGMVTACLLILLPYFMFLFRFLAPRNVITRIAAQALEAARRGKRDEMLGAIEELEDLSRGARQHHDRSIALASVDALADVLRGYVELRPELDAPWFRIDGELARDPDFVALAPSATAELEQQRTWLEAKILRQFLSLFDESIGEDRDLGSLIALNTQALAAELADRHPPIVDLAIRFFNSYLRVSIRAGDLRTAYYVLDRYRALGEEVLDRGETERLTRIAAHLHEYGDFACDLGLGFLLEVVAFDIASLVERAAERLPDQVDPLLDRLLSVDRVLEDDDRVECLLGVRRTQIQLATYFLQRNDEARARTIATDMRGDNRRRLLQVREQLENETREQYWEFTDRGINFSYLEPERRTELARFFALPEESA